MTLASPPAEDGEYHVDRRGLKRMAEGAEVEEPAKRELFTIRLVHILSKLAQVIIERRKHTDTKPRVDKSTTKLPVQSEPGTDDALKPRIKKKKKPTNEIDAIFGF